MNEIKPFDDVYFNLVKENLSKFIIYEPDFTHITANWSELVESFSDEIIMQYSVGDYSGDYYFVIKLKSYYGFVSIAYGSCSGCDALEGCESLDELNSLQNSVWNDIRWFSTLDDLKQWAIKYDWEGCEYISGEQLIEFKNVMNALSN